MFSDRLYSAFLLRSTAVLVSLAVLGSVDDVAFFMKRFMIVFFFWRFLAFFRRVKRPEHGRVKRSAHVFVWREDPTTLLQNWRGVFDAILLNGLLHSLGIFARCQNCQNETDRRLAQAWKIRETAINSSHDDCYQVPI